MAALICRGWGDAPPGGARLAYAVAVAVAVAVAAGSTSVELSLCAGVIALADGDNSGEVPGRRGDDSGEVLERRVTEPEGGPGRPC